MKYVIYIIAAIAALEIFREYMSYRRKKRLNNKGEISKWALERYIDFKKLIALIVLCIAVYFLFPVIKEAILPGISGLKWFFNLKLFYLFLKVIGAIVIVEVLYKFVLIKFLRNMASLWGRLIRYFYWGVLIFLVIGLWPFGKIAVEKIKGAINKPYAPRTEKERREVEEIKKFRQDIDKLKETSRERQSVFDGF